MDGGKQAGGAQAADGEAPLMLHRDDALLALQARGRASVWGKVAGEAAQVPEIALPDWLRTALASERFRLQPWLVATAIFLAWIIPGVVGRDLWKPDEGYTFGLVWHILQTGDWVVPTLVDEPFMEKPPIFYLVAALTARLASPVLPLYDGARLASLVFMAITCLFVALASRVLFAARPSWLAPLLLIGSAGLLIHAHQLITDVALLAGFAIAIHGLACLSANARTAGMWLGLGVGVAFLAKGLLIPGVVGITCLLLPVLYPRWRTRPVAYAFAVALLVALPWLIAWPLAVYVRSPSLFSDWLWVNNFGRFFGFAHLAPPAMPGDYLSVLPWFTFPLLVPAVWGLVSRGRGAWSDPAVQITTTLLAVLLGVLGLASNARELYALPVLLPLALLAADGLDRVPQSLERAFFAGSAVMFTLVGSAIWLCGMALNFGMPTSLAHAFRQIQPEFIPHPAPGIFLAACAYSFAWIAVLLKYRRDYYRTALVWTAGIAISWGLMCILMLDWFDIGMSYRAVSGRILQALPAQHGCIASRGLGESQRGVFDSIGLRTRRTEVDAASGCDLLLVQGFFGQDPSPGVGWSAIWDGARPGDRKEHFWLYRRSS
jgi:4-amino-4-deoxy-L-arabinose transferase-like glycosyltransferase